MAMTNFVKFIRGTTEAFNKLTTKDNDTLYFISDTSDTTTGKLYLGSRLIGSGSVADALQSIKLTDLANKDLLVYDEASGSWVNSSIEDVFSKVMVGATSTTDGESGFVPMPEAGEQGKFLRGDGTWAHPMLYGSSEFEVTVNETDPLNRTLHLLNFRSAENNTIALKTSEGKLSWIKPSTLIPNLALSRKIVTDLSDIDLTATDAGSYIYMIANSGEYNNHYDEYMVINGNLEKMGTTATDLSDYATKTDLTSKINEVNTEINSIKLTLNGTNGDGLINKVNTIQNSLNNYVLTSKYNSEVGDLTALLRQVSADSTIVEEINDINERIAWQDLKK